jgi:hypothetical protein
MAGNAFLGMVLVDNSVSEKTLLLGISVNRAKGQPPTLTAGATTNVKRDFLRKSH